MLYCRPALPEFGADELSMSDKEYNFHIASLRAPVERLVAHFKNWKYSKLTIAVRPLTMTRSMPLAEISSSRSYGVLNNVQWIISYLITG